MFIVIFLGVLAGTSAGGAHSRQDLRVYRGDNDTHHEFPFAVALQQKELPLRRICTGSLIANDWVLTAAHCVHRSTPRDIVKIVIRYGDFTKLPNETKMYSRVIKIYVHPHQKWVEGINDIAIISIEKILKKAHARLLAFDYKTLFGLPVKYAGFGHTDKDIKYSPRNFTEAVKVELAPLKVGEGVVIPCERHRYKYSLLCTAPKCAKRTQQSRPGDSGGPLVYDGRLVGLDRGSENLYPISQFTAISPYLEWIQNTMISNKK